MENKCHARTMLHEIWKTDFFFVFCFQKKEKKTTEDGRHSESFASSGTNADAKDSNGAGLRQDDA